MNLKTAFPNSEKWFPILVVVWGMILVSCAVWGAWYDPERYEKAIKVLGHSVQWALVIAVWAVSYYSRNRMEYKEKIAIATVKEIGNIPEM